MIQTPGAKGSKKVTNPFSACHPLVFGRLRTMESPDSINGWERSIAFARSAVTVREAAAMSAVCKEKRWLTLIRHNRCIVVITKPALWHSKFELIWLQSVIRWLLSAKRNTCNSIWSLYIGNSRYVSIAPWYESAYVCRVIFWIQWKLIFLKT